MSAPTKDKKHANAQLIKALYNALRDQNSEAAAACYAKEARFQDIAFQLNGVAEIRQMWRFVCDRDLRVTFDSIVADDREGSGHWVAEYTISDNGRPVRNDTRSRFKFSDGGIVEHIDDCDPMQWAAQAYPFPKSLLAGLCGPLRRRTARKKLRKYIAAMDGLAATEQPDDRVEDQLEKIRFIEPS